MREKETHDKTEVENLLDLALTMAELKPGEKSKIMRSFRRFFSEPAFIDVDFVETAQLLRNGRLVRAALGRTRGIDKARQAAKLAASDIRIEEAKKLLLFVTGGGDLEIEDTSRALDYIKAAADHNCEIIVSVKVDEGFNGEAELIILCIK